MPKAGAATTRTSMSLRSDPRPARPRRGGSRACRTRADARGAPLDLGVAAHAQQRVTYGSFDEHVHGAAQHVVEPVGGAAARMPRLVEHALEQRSARCRARARGSRPSRRSGGRSPTSKVEAVGEHAHRRRVVAVLDERGHGDVEDPLLVVPRAPASECSVLRHRPHPRRTVDLDASRRRSRYASIRRARRRPRAHPRGSGAQVVDPLVRSPSLRGSAPGSSSCTRPVEPINP